MNGLYKFVAGNSKITPVCVVVALVLAYLLRGVPYGPGVYLGVLLLSLALSVFERVT